MVPAVRLVEDLLLSEIGQHPRRVLAPEPLAPLERDLERAALEVLHQHVEVVGVHQPSLRRPAEHVVGVLHDVLVGRRARRDEERDRQVLAATGPTHLLPGRRDGPRVAHENGGLQRADVDPELERVRRDDASHGAVAQTALDRATLAREVSAAVATHEVGRPLRLGEASAEIGEEELGLHARAREGDRLHA